MNLPSVVNIWSEATIDESTRELNVDEYYEGRMETAQMLIESREKLEQLRHDSKRHTKTVQENNQSTQEE